MWPALRFFKTAALEPPLEALRDSAWTDYCTQVSLIGPPAVVLGLAAPLGAEDDDSLEPNEASSPVIDSATVDDVTVDEAPMEGDESDEPETDPSPAPTPTQLHAQTVAPQPAQAHVPYPSSPQHPSGSRSWASVASKPGDMATTVTPTPALSAGRATPTTSAETAPVPPATPAAGPAPAPAPAPVPAAASPSKVTPQVVTPSAAPVTRETVNAKDFDWEGAAKKARHFVIKSYTEDDVRQSLRFNVWASTDSGNRRLDGAYREHHALGPVFLYFSVNGSGHFCGMAQMTSPLDFTKKVDVWASDKWNGCFTIKWLFVKNIPNNACRHIKLECVSTLSVPAALTRPSSNNEGKPVTNSRDTQEVLQAPGRELLRIIATYTARSSLLDGEKPDAAAAPAATASSGKAARR